MATYAFSDVHGHRAPLERLLDRVSPSNEDRIFMLGDMIDRGPDPVGVLKICRDLPGAHVLMGNHEDLMLAYFDNPEDPVALGNWEINGGSTTAEGLEALAADEAVDLINWVQELPLYAHAKVGGRLYGFVHAGIDASRIQHHETWDEAAFEEMLASQNPDDLLWIRDEFWGRPTGLVNEMGEGPVIIAGHTPSAYLAGMADRLSRDPMDDEGLCRMVRVGACSATRYVADRWDIDSGAAGGAGFGRVGLVRIDDGEEFYEKIEDGE